MRSTFFPASPEPLLMSNRSSMAWMWGTVSFLALATSLARSSASCPAPCRLDTMPACKACDKRCGMGLPCQQGR